MCARYGYDGFVRLDHHQPCRARMIRGDTVFREIDDRCWGPDRRLRDCAESGVTVQVLSTVPVMFSYWAQPADTLDLARMLNDHIAEVVRAHPTRFVGLGTLPMQDSERAIRELERCRDSLGLAGVQIGSNVNGRNLDEPELFAIFEACQRLQAAVFVHPWEVLGRERMDRYWLPWLVGMPAETAVAICSLLFGGVLERLPDLRIAFAHGGGSFPATLGRIDHGFRVRPDLCATHTQTGPRDQMGRFYVDSLVHDAAALRQLIAVLGPERIALGSDYPFPLGEAVPGQLLASMDDLSAAARERILSGTALEFLRLDRGRFGPVRPPVPGN